MFIRIKGMTLLLVRSTHIYYIMCVRAACLVSVRSLSKIEFRVSKSEHKNASEDFTPVASRKRVQRYDLFPNPPNV